MNTALPTAEQLRKLPMRAVVAYAARTARRVSAEFTGVVADEILDEALRLLDDVWMTTVEVDPAAVIRAGGRVVAAYAAAPLSMRSPTRNRLLFSFAHAAITAMHVLKAAADPTRVGHEMKHAAEAAHRAVRTIESLSGGAATTAAEAARRDYEVLLREYGERNEDVLVGDSVSCFGGEAESGRGSLTEEGDARRLVSDTAERKAEGTMDESL